nr:MAG TPA: hypothetical protein [Caudoviricetes sp.]
MLNPHQNGRRSNSPISYQNYIMRHDNKQRVRHSYFSVLTPLNFPPVVF